MATATVDDRRWTREEYERLAEQGYFHPEERLELVDRILNEMTPQSSFHYRVRMTHVSLVSDLFLVG